MSIPTTITDWCSEVHSISTDHGFWEESACSEKSDGENPPKNPNHTRVLAALALIHTEVAEASEDVRKNRWMMYLDADGKPQGFTVELADTIIRCFDLAAALGVEADLERAVEAKVEFNRGRPYKHGKEC